ncbi:MAG: glycosyltransferase family 2 protein [Bacteroidaceae bacterium]|nr:glycosyltransferase family 2 protein [Bacteroidaceae bacterium]
MIKLSLVIATYNRAEQLMITLRSVAAQTADKTIWECIVVDNNSTDHTHSNIDNFANANSHLNIRYCLEVNQGLSHARNAGIANAKGEIIAFIDDDEHIVPDFIDAYIELFDKYPTAMSAGGKIIAEYPSGRPEWMSKYAEEPIANPMDFGEEIKPFPKGRIPGGGNMAMRKEVFETIGNFDITLGRTGKKLSGGEESDLFERMNAKGMKCYYVPKAVMYHIIPESKLNRDYFVRLSYNNGIGQWTRATLHSKRISLIIREICKWGATFLLCITHRPVQSKYLILMRWNISKGIINAARS